MRIFDYFKISSVSSMYLLQVGHAEGSVFPIDGVMRLRILTIDGEHAHVLVGDIVNLDRGSQRHEVKRNFRIFILKEPKTDRLLQAFYSVEDSHNRRKPKTTLC
jgi:hypothetical protein